MKKRGKQRGKRTKAPTPVALQPVTTSAVVREDGLATESREKIAAELEEMFSKVCGTKTPAVASSLATQVANLLAWNRPDPKGGGLDLFTTPAAFLAEIGPRTGLEAMLAVQMIGVHEAATVFLRRAQPDRDTGDEAEANVQRAVRLMRLFNEQIGVMAKLKGTASQQKVTVEHVHVHQGGQAIVGAVGSPATIGRGDGS